MNYLDLFAGALQVSAAAYALRINRLFGTRHLGWWLFGAFALQAVFFLAESSLRRPALPAKFEVLYLLTSLMLLIAMAQIGRLQNARVELERGKEKTRSELEALVRAKTADLVQINRDLRKEITRRHENEQALNASEEQYRFLFTENPQPMWVFDRESLRFLTVNNAALRHYGFTREQFCAMTAKEMRPPEDVPLFLQDAARPSPGIEHRGIWRHYKQNGSLVEVETTVTDFTYENRPARLVIASDITERVAMEKQLRQAQKMEAIGQLAGGVAHDFNNILTVMQGYAGLLLAGKHDPSINEHLKQIAAAAERGAGLTRQLLAFSRRHFLQLQPGDLNEIIKNLTRMLRRLIGEDIMLENIYHPNMTAVLADPGMLEQVVMNLVVNARDAMPNGGTLTILTSVCEVDAAHVQRHQEARTGKFVCLSVRDTGCGMKPEVLSHLFEPFFTTKDVGKGTGLGLATVYGIVRQHSGWVEVSTTLGAGSEFQVYLPCAPATAMPSANHAPAHIRAGKETILVVEDEHVVRQLAGLILTGHGYKVIEASCGAKALAIWKEKSAEIDLVFSDIVMPGGISGRDLADRLRQTKADLKVLLTSGYSPSRAGQDQRQLQGLKFLPKPYNSERLLSAIQEGLS